MTLERTVVGLCLDVLNLDSAPSVPLITSLRLKSISHPIVNPFQLSRAVQRPFQFKCKRRKNWALSRGPRALISTQPILIKKKRKPRYRTLTQSCIKWLSDPEKSKPFRAYAGRTRALGWRSELVWRIAFQRATRRGGMPSPLVNFKRISRSWSDSHCWRLRVCDCCLVQITTTGLPWGRLDRSSERSISGLIIPMRMRHVMMRHVIRSMDIVWREEEMGEGKSRSSSLS